MAKPDEPPGGDSGGGTPPAGEGADDVRLGEAIEAAVRKVFAEATRPPASSPPAVGGPAGGGPAGTGAPTAAGGVPAADTSSGNLGDAIAAAVNRALAERDREDALGVLANEIDALKAALKAAPPARKRGWGAFLLGPGSLTR